MVATAVPPQLGGAFLPVENARRLSIYRYVETALMRVMAARIATVPELDVKIELARQVAFAAERADALWKRTAQLLWPDDRDVRLHPAAAALLRDVEERAQGTAGLLGGLGLVASSLARAYHEHAAATDPISDAPTVRLLGRLEEDASALGDWAGSRATALATDGAEAFVWSLEERIVAAGESWVTLPPDEAAGVSLHAELQRAPEGPTARVATVARDERFRDLGPDETPPPEPLDTPAGRLAYLLRTLNFELFAAELMGRNLYELGPSLPWQFTMDMARQCWDEARHTEISCKLGDHMGTYVGEFAEGTFLYEAACNPDPVLRLTGVNRALEGLAIDVFNTMREFGDVSGDPVLEFCEDWMLADEVTHVKMGSDWLRRLTEHDPERRERALEFQRVVDKLFSFRGFRGEADENPVQLARTFRRMAGFEEAEIDEIAESSKQTVP
jgi:uncharacterized ferritin-like protein (DUF455 family)